MNATTRRVRKWFWAWDHDKEEAWLSGMSRQGWHLRSAQIFGLYIFEQGEPRDYAYRLDYKSTAQADMAEYVQLFRDAGWEHLGDMLGWQYFRKPVKEGETAEIFTDVESKVQKYQRVLTFLLLTAPVWLSCFVVLPSPKHPVGVVLAVLVVLMFMFYAFVFAKLLGRINQLKRL